ncbi:MAG: IS66 family insertion sequence element accessory protein TnpB, partial [Herminiimonas sp.]|nr:IS66 family insertion sequence element accessory protein TnpB [Herminiimonas sp.]
DDDPLSGHVFVFRGRRGNVVKVLWATTDGVCLLAKRLERGHFVWPQACWRRLKIDPVGVRRNTWSVFGRHQQSQRLCVIKGETVSLACR